jgi:SAM-dependent methyltransferase
MTASTDVNYQYFVHYVKRLPHPEQLRILDYGCGEGQVVRLLREAGYNCHGCDIYYGGGQAQELPQLKQLVSLGFVHVIPEDGDLPYQAGSFDVILANQVFEHVKDLGAVLRRLAPLLRPGGHLLAHFPTKEVWKEGHIGIPFAHWFPQGSKFRAVYTLGLRWLGMGYFKRPGESGAQWTTRQLAWIDSYCFYVPLADLHRTMQERFAVSHNELPYMRFRASNRHWLVQLLRLPGTASLWCRLFRRLAFTAVILRPVPTRNASRHSGSRE